MSGSRSAVDRLVRRGLPREIPGAQGGLKGQSKWTRYLLAHSQRGAFAYPRALLPLLPLLLHTHVTYLCVSRILSASVLLVLPCTTSRWNDRRQRLLVRQSHGSLLACMPLFTRSTHPPRVVSRPSRQAFSQYIEWGGQYAECLLPAETASADRSVAAPLRGARSCSRSGFSMRRGPPASVFPPQRRHARTVLPFFFFCASRRGPSSSDVVALGTT